MNLAKPRRALFMTTGTYWRIAIAVVVIVLAGQTFSAQTPEAKPPQPLPTSEQYKPSTDILVPWRYGGCGGLLYYRCEIGMPQAIFEGSHVLALYNRDGSIWRVYDTSRKAPNFYAKAGELVPIANISVDSGPVLRIKGESEHWYQVIVNEDTGTVAYALKVPFDPENVGMWAKTTFEYWLRGRRYIKRQPELSPLLDAPSGKPIATDEERFWQVEFIKLDRPDGEWAYVRANDEVAGWIRLREGRKFFVVTPFSIELLGDGRRK